MLSSEECIYEDNKEKPQKDSQERPHEPEEPDNRPVNWKLYFEVSFAQRGQVVGKLLLAQLWQSIQLPMRRLWGAGWCYMFPCLFVDDLTESFMSSG